MKRQVTFTVYEVGIRALVKAEDGRYDMVDTPVAKVEEGHMTDTMARKAIAEAGYMVKRGTNVYWKPLVKRRYFYTTEQLKSICTDFVEEVIAEETTEEETTEEELIEQ